MKRSLIALTLLSIFACDPGVPGDQGAVAFRGGETCEACLADQAEMLAEHKQAYTEYDSSLGFMLDCLDDGISEDECRKLTLNEGGQTDTYDKWVQLLGEAAEACLKPCN